MRVGCLEYFLCDNEHKTPRNKKERKLQLYQHKLNKYLLEIIQMGDLGQINQIFNKITPSK